MEPNAIPIHELESGLAQMHALLSRCIHIIEARGLDEEIPSPRSSFEEKIHVLIFGPDEIMYPEEGCSWTGHMLLESEWIIHRLGANPEFAKQIV